MWYTTKVVPDMANAARELAVHMSHPDIEHGKTLRHLIGYLKGKNTKSLLLEILKFLSQLCFLFQLYHKYGNKNEYQRSSR